MLSVHHSDLHCCERKQIINNMETKINARLYFKSVLNAFKITFKANWFYPFSQVLMLLIQNTLPFISLYMFNRLLNLLSSDNIDPREAIATAVIYIVFLGAQMLISTFMGTLVSILTERMDLKFQEMYIKKQMNLPLSFSDSPHGRDVIGLAQNEMGDIYALFNFFIEFVTNVYAFVIAARILISFNALFAVIFLILILPSCIADYRHFLVGTKFHRRNLGENRFHSYYRDILTQQETAKDVRLYDLTEPLKKRYFDYHNKYLREKREINSATMRVDTFYNVLQSLGMAFFLVVLIGAKYDGSITVGDLVMYSGIALTYVSKAKDIAGTLDFTVQFVVWLQPVYEYLGVKGFEEKTGGKELSSFESLEFRDVFFKCPSADDYVLKGVSFKITKNERVSIVGINGAGKSTIVKIMVGLYEIDSGEILINDIPLHEYSNKSVKRLFSVMLQDFPTYSLTLRENVALSDIDHADDERILASLQKAGVDDDLCDLDRYMTRAFDDKGMELSKGQWQKIAVARTYFKNSPVVILDEPSSALDAEAEERIFRTFSELSENKTSIMITHHISGVRESDRILVLDEGVIKESGNHASLMEQDGLYRQMFELQRSKYQGD